MHISRAESCACIRSIPWYPRWAWCQLKSCRCTRPGCDWDPSNIPVSRNGPTYQFPFHKRCSVVSVVWLIACPWPGFDGFSDYDIVVGASSPSQKTGNHGWTHLRKITDGDIDDGGDEVVNVLVILRDSSGKSRSRSHHNVLNIGSTASCY